MSGFHEGVQLQGLGLGNRRDTGPEECDDLLKKCVVAGIRPDALHTRLAKG